MRILLIAILVALSASILVPRGAFAETAGNKKIAVFHDLVQALGDAGDAIKKLTDGIKHLIATSNDGYKYVSAVRERTRLIDLSRKTQHIIAVQNVRVVNSIDDYLQIRNPEPDDWELVKHNLERVLTDVEQLLRDVKAENGSFVAESPYLDLNKTLHTRATTLEKLISLPPPKSKADRKSLRLANEKYKILIRNAELAVAQLNEYIRRQDKH